MLRIVLHVLRAVTIIAILCALAIGAKVELHAHAQQAAPEKSPIGGTLHQVAEHWFDNDWDSGWSMPVKDQEAIHKTFTVAPVDGSRLIQVDNISGSIEVVGGDQSEVRMDVDKTLHAESNAALESARKEVTLEISQDPGLLRIHVNDPSNCDGPDCWHFRDEPYLVEMNFRLQIPHDSDLTLKTVNGREVNVRGVHGHFQ
jgi:hypothetical protein